MPGRNQGNPALDAKLLRVLEALEFSLGNNQRQQRQDHFADSVGNASKAADAFSRLAGTMAFHMERAVGGIVAFRNALNVTYDRINQPAVTHRGVSTVLSSGGGGAGAGKGGAASGPVTKSFETIARTQYESGQRSAASAALAASKFQMAVDVLGTAATLVVNIGASIAKFFDAALQAGSPNAWATLNKSMTLVMATIGKELTPVAARFAMLLQRLVTDWDRLDATTKEFLTDILLIVSGIDLAVKAFELFVEAVKAVEDLFDFAVGKSPAEKEGEKAEMSKRMAALASGAFTPQQMAEMRQKNKEHQDPHWTVRMGDRFERGEREGGIQGALSGLAKEWWKSATALTPLWLPSKDKMGPDKDFVTAFQRTANPQFMAMDQVWRNVQLNLLGKDELDVKILEAQLKGNEHLAKIEGNTKKSADKASGVKVD